MTACNAQVCGNTRLRSFVAQQLRGEGNAAAQMEKALRAALESAPKPAAEARPPAPEHKLDLRLLRAHVMTAVRQLPMSVARKVRAAPGWVWAILILSYIALTGKTWRRLRRSPLTTLRLDDATLNR